MIGGNEAAYRLFHLWLILASLVVFAGYLTVESGIFAYVVGHDPSRLSLVISALFTAGTIHCGVLSHRLAGEADALQRLLQETGGSGATLAATVAQTPADEATKNVLTLAYFRALAARLAGSDGVNAGEYTQLTDVLSEQMRGQHEAGWFVTNMLVKLGLLGTVIGFILMLGSVMQIEAFAIEDAQGMLGSMTVGMGVALNTTMFGLVSSMLLGVQYLLIDRGADRLIATAVFTAEAELIPALLRPRDGV